MTRDKVIARAKEMRELQAKMVKIAQDGRMPFGTRYEATIKAEDYEEAARGFDRTAEHLMRNRFSQKRGPNAG